MHQGRPSRTPFLFAHYLNGHISFTIIQSRGCEQMAIDGFSALITGVIAGTLKATAARAVAPRLLSIGSREVSNFSRNWRLPENHDVQKALRTAQHEAVLNTLADFEAWAGKDVTTELSADEQRFVDIARSEALAGKRAANNVERGLDAAGMQRLAKSLDLALAGKLGLDERADALRLAASQAILSDVARSVVRAGGPGAPERFRAIFIGELRHVEGWHPRFVAFASQALKDKPAYRDIFVAEKLCVISDKLDGLHDAVTTGFLDMSGQMTAMRSDLMQQMARARGVPLENLRPLFEAVGRDVPDEGFEHAVRHAVDELLARARQKPQAFNDPEEIQRAIQIAREKLSRLDTDGAVEHLRRARAEQAESREERQRGEARLATEEAEILKSAYRFDEAIVAFEAAGRLDPHSAWAWFEAGDIHVHRGRLAKALDAYREGSRAASLYGDQRDLSVSHDRIGNVELRLGNVDAALAAYRKSLAIAEALGLHDPANTEWQRDLSVSHNRIGDVELLLGNGDAALAAYRKSLAIREALSLRDPANTEWQRDLSISHNRIGDVELLLGNGDAALAAYRRSHANFETLGLRDPANNEWQRDLSVSYTRIGDVELRLGDADAARAAYHNGLTIAEALGLRDPANTEWQRDLSISHNRIGDVELRLGNGDAALDAYRKGLAIAEALSLRDPANTKWQRDLSVSHNRIGDVELRLDNSDAALAAYGKGLAIAEALALRDPANTEWQRDLSISYTRIGDVELRLGNGDAALAAYSKDLAIAEALGFRDPANTEWQQDLSISHNKIGDVELRLGNGDAALAAYRKGLAIRESLGRRDPANTEWQRDLSISHNKIGDVELRLGNGDAALAAYRKGLAIAEALGLRDPANTQWQRDLIVSHVKLSESGGDSRRHLEGALAIATRLAGEGRLAPVDASMVGDLRQKLAALG
jgi:tetratricopeptide (TPR) repeat protein